MRALDKSLLRLSVPSILAGITVPLVGMVDMAVAGHLDGPGAALIGGITIGSMLFDLLYWNFAFLRTGTGGLTAQAFGRGDRREMGDVLLRALAVALLSSLVLIAIQWLVTWAALGVISATPEVKDLAARYFHIRIWAAPATLSLMALKGWFIGMQDSVSAMAADLTVNGVNIVASIFLSFGIGAWEGMGYDGVAAGTVLAQYSGLLLCIGILFGKYRHVLGKVTPGRALGVLRKGAGAFFRMNTDLFIRSLCFIGVYIGFTVISARYGDALLATASIAMKIMMFFSYFTDGFAYGGEALTGRFIGERKEELVRETIRRTFVWSLGLAGVFAAINLLFSAPIAALLTDDPAVRELAGHFVPWLAAMPLAAAPAFTWDGIFTGATATRAMRDSALWAVAAFLLAWAGARWAGCSGISAIHALMAAYFAHLLARDLVLTFRQKDVFHSFR